MSQTPPDWTIAHWLNTPAPLTLASLRGRAVLAVAFQMLCPGCVSQGLPQAQRARTTFAEHDLAVIGLHTVFEHHDAMTPIALAAFIHEYRLAFPIGVDESGSGTPIPVTMGRYGMRGTPTTILIGRDGRLASHQFGQIDDMALGAQIASLLCAESGTAAGCDAGTDNGCGSESCPNPEATRREDTE